MGVFAKRYYTISVLLTGSMLPEQQRFLNIGKQVFIFFGIAPGPPRGTRRVRRPDRALRVAKLRTNRWSSRADRIDRSPCGGNGGNVRCRTATALVPKTYDLWQSDVTCHVLTWFMTGARPPSRPLVRPSFRPFASPTVRPPPP